MDSSLSSLDTERVTMDVCSLASIFLVSNSSKSVGFFEFFQIFSLCWRVSAQDGGLATESLVIAGLSTEPPFLVL